MKKEDFWDYVSKGSDCWEWQRGLTYKGYGTLRIGNKVHKAHRLAYELAISEVPPGMCVCHRCDNPKCVKPEHLFLGTNQENTADRHRKGRDPKVRGEGHHRSKVTSDAVIDIRTKRLPQAEFAKLYGISTGGVAHIQKFRSWKHLADD